MLVETSKNPIPIFAINEQDWEKFASRLKASEREFCVSNKFDAKAGSSIVITNSSGNVQKTLLGMGKSFDPVQFGGLGRTLPQGTYEIKSRHKKFELELAVLFFELGRYFYSEFKKSPRKEVGLLIPQGLEISQIQNTIEIICASRDLINRPANMIGPKELSDFARHFAKTENLEIEEIIGDDLLSNNYPLIHAVGRGSANHPRFLIIRKPKNNAPKVGIVGKGVTFDTGGLNLKPGSSMALMKKDMGGAACAIALFRLLLNQDLDIDLNLYLPMVENSVSGNAMRPGDIISSRLGLNIEIDNTDAEGRLILADALTRASQDEMEFIIDFATLTGAARVALGPDLPPFYTDNDDLAFAIKTASQKVKDPVWQLPLWEAYYSDFDSIHADMKNSGGAFAGSITAALFLKKFVSSKDWIHFDVYCHSPKDKGFSPMGGEVQAVRAMFEVILSKYKKAA